ncbi:LysM peptidoglycan-binding domain-containing protein [Mesobacillus boroniphilus]|uniref:LysM peptidoglycan-binding domain-containing protein n=1 Tax=Mesobacillus boroniphilus TaxID=308892 RepID=A0A944GWL8_9BACI|nr:LysM peptidoglycan-binding domain-containing protein [Mesobacillus boroniphilus]MBS8263800.1 LysM peptidoglycan-binding domain-containing protein [Mesobacillus boroniphilus]
MNKIKRLLQLGLSVLLMISLLFFTNGFGYADDHDVTVKKGDTLYSLSKKHNLTVQELKDFNGLKNNTIYIGQKLLLPGLTESEPMYAVVAGSFSKKDNATKQIANLKKKGIEATVITKVIYNKTYYCIQAGVFSKKVNAEKQKKLLRKNGITDAYIVTSKNLHVLDVHVGFTYSQLLQQFGKPVKTEDQLNIRSLYYNGEGAGVRVNFNMENGSVFGLQVYPEYLKLGSLPKEKSQVINVYGYPNDVKNVSCYESATCGQFIYQFNKHELIIQFDRDGKTVQYFDLSRLH